METYSNHSKQAIQKISSHLNMPCITSSQLQREGKLLKRYTYSDAKSFHVKPSDQNEKTWHQTSRTPFLSQYSLTTS